MVCGSVDHYASHIGELILHWCWVALDLLEVRLSPASHFGNLVLLAGRLSVPVLCTPDAHVPFPVHPGLVSRQGTLSSTCYMLGPSLGAGTVPVPRCPLSNGE